MLVIDVQKQPEAAWRTYLHDIRIKIKGLSDEQRAELREQATINGRFDLSRFTRLCYRETIVDWQGFVDPAGKPLPRTDEHVDVVTSQLPQLAAWVLAESARVNEEEAAKRADLLKNSQSSRDGSTASPKA